MLRRRSLGGGLALALPIALFLPGCTSEDPESADFAANCNAAYSVFYVEGGKGPAYKDKSKRELYWRDRYYKIAGISDDTAKQLIKINYDMAYSHRKESTADRNAAMKEVMDYCASYETSKP